MVIIMGSFSVSSGCDRDLEPLGMSCGCYYVIKKSVIKSFRFSSESEAYTAFQEMQKFVSERKDSSNIRVQLV